MFIEKSSKVFCFFIGILMFFSSNVYSSSSIKSSEYFDMDLELLLDLKVTSVMQREQRLLDISHAMTIITKEDIKRKGAKNLPDLFVGIAGVMVNSSTDHQYAIGIRDGASTFNKNLLILLDGVVVYSHAFSGTFWEAIPVSLEEIEKIEIIRGSGGVLYGANAVEGVINIITKSGMDDKDDYVYLKAGNRDSLDTGIGIYVESKDDTKLRYWGHYEEDDGFSDKWSAATGVNGRVRDEMDHTNSFGFKLDKDFDEQTHLSIVGAYGNYYGENTLVSPMADMDMKNLFVRYDKKISDTHDYYIQAYWNGFVMEPVLSTSINAYNFLIQHNIQHNMFDKKSIFSIGAGFNYTDMHESNILIKTKDHFERVPSLFLHNEMWVTEKTIWSVGVRGQHNSRINTEDSIMISPETSLVYKLNKNHSFSFRATQAYHVPGYAESIGNVFYGVVNYVGDINNEPMRLDNFQLGYKGFFMDNKIQVNAYPFVMKKNDIIAAPRTAPLTGFITNKKDELLQGLELDFTFNPFSWLKLYTDHTFLDSNIDHNNDSWGVPSNQSIRNRTNSVPSYYGGVGVQFTYNKFKFDGYLRYVDKYAFIGFTDSVTNIPESWRLNLRLAYEIELKNGNSIELELVGRDLIGGDTIEDTNGYYVEETLFAGIKWKF